MVKDGNIEVPTITWVDLGGCIGYATLQQPNFRGDLAETTLRQLKFFQRCDDYGSAWCEDDRVAVLLEGPWV